MHAIDEKQSLLVKLIRDWGDLNTDAVLDTPCQFFSIPSVEGVIAYRIEANCAIVFGEPLSAPGDRTKLAEAFHHYCQEAGLNVVYVIVSKPFTKSIPSGCFIQFGHKLILDPEDDPLKKTGSNAQLLRKKVKHASKAGLIVSEYFGGDPALEKEMEQIGHSWLQARHGPQIYIAHLSLFNNREGKRWFYAEHKNGIAGFCILNEIKASSGWLLNNLIISRDAPSGTSELIIASALETLAKENCRFVEVGPVVATHIEIGGLGTISSWFVRRIFSIFKKLYHLDGQAIFWEKFQPKKEPSYLLFDQVNLRTIKALLHALNIS